MSESSKAEIELKIEPVVTLLVTDRPEWAKDLTQEQYENYVQWFNHMLLEATDWSFDAAWENPDTRVTTWTFTRKLTFPWLKN